MSETEKTLNIANFGWGFTSGEQQEKKIRCGADFKTDTPDGLWRLYGEKGEFLMLGKSDGGVMTTVKSFFEV